MSESRTLFSNPHNQNARSISNAMQIQCKCNTAHNIFFRIHTIRTSGQYLMQYKYNTNVMPLIISFSSNPHNQNVRSISNTIQIQYKWNAAHHIFFRIHTIRLSNTIPNAIQIQYKCNAAHDIFFSNPHNQNVRSISNAIQIQHKCNVTHYVFFFESTQLERPANI